MTFLVIPRSSETFKDSETVCKPFARDEASSLILDLEYYIYKRGEQVLQMVEKFYTGTYILRATEKLTNPIAPLTGLNMCNLRKWYFYNADPLSKERSRPKAVAPEQLIRLPYAMDSRVYECTLYNSPFKVLTSSLPAGTGAYMVIGWAFVMGAAFMTAKQQQAEVLRKQHSAHVAFV